MSLVAATGVHRGQLRELRPSEGRGGRGAVDCCHLREEGARSVPAGRPAAHTYYPVAWAQASPHDERAQHQGISGARA